MAFLLVRLGRERHGTVRVSSGRGISLHFFGTNIGQFEGPPDGSKPTFFLENSSLRVWVRNVSDSDSVSNFYTVIVTKIVFQIIAI